MTDMPSKDYLMAYLEASLNDGPLLSSVNRYYVEVNWEAEYQLNWRTIPPNFPSNPACEAEVEAWLAIKGVSLQTCDTYEQKKKLCENVVSRQPRDWYPMNSRERWPISLPYGLTLGHAQFMLDLANIGVCVVKYGDCVNLALTTPGEAWEWRIHAAYVVLGSFPPARGTLTRNKPSWSLLPWQRLTLAAKIRSARIAQQWAAEYVITLESAAKLALKEITSIIKQLNGEMNSLELLASVDKNDSSVEFLDRVANKESDNVPNRT